MALCYERYLIDVNVLHPLILNNLDIVPNVLTFVPTRYIIILDLKRGDYRDEKKEYNKPHKILF